MMAQLLLLCALLGQAAVAPRPSLASLFDGDAKDFGSVPHGTLNIHRFTLKNSTGAVVRLDNLRSTCVCATAFTPANIAKPGEDLIIEVRYDAGKFVGPRSMTIYAEFGAPHKETVAFRISGTSRKDVTITPGEVDFGTVPRGEGARRAVTIEYAGVLDWRITSLQANPAIVATANELERAPGRARYRLDVELRPEAAAGRIDDLIVIGANDPTAPQLRLHVNAKVEAAVSAAPDSLRLGAIPIGAPVSKRIILRSGRPFSITACDGVSESVKVFASEGSRTLHVLRVEITPSTPGKIERKLLLHTDVAGEAVLEIPVEATIMTAGP